MKDVKNVHAAALIAHGNNDFNVMTKNAAQFYDALKAQGVPHQFYFHQGGHGGAPPDAMINRWFTKYLWGQDNGVENLPKSWVVREAATCPPRQTTVDGRPVQHRDAHRRRARARSWSARRSRSRSDERRPARSRPRRRVITNIPDATHITLAAAVATAAGSKVAGGAIVNLACGTANPTPYAEWPDPASAPRRPEARHGRRRAAAALGFNGAAAGTTETLTDDAAHRRHGAARRGDLAEPPASTRRNAAQQRPADLRHADGLAQRRVLQARRRTCRRRWSATRPRARPAA